MIGFARPIYRNNDALSGISQAELGIRTGVSQQVITNYERGIREPNIEKILKIAGA